MWDAFVSYFQDKAHQKSAVSKELKKFFEEKNVLKNQAYFCFLEFALKPFDTLNRVVQSNKFSFIELLIEVKKFKQVLENCKNEKFYGNKTLMYWIR